MPQKNDKYKEELMKQSILYLAENSGKLGWYVTSMSGKINVRYLMISILITRPLYRNLESGLILQKIEKEKDHRYIRSVLRVFTINRNK